MKRTKLTIAVGLIAVALATALIGFGPAVVQAHAQFVASVPAANSVVPAVPATIEITFTEPLEPSATGAVLQGSDGQPVAGVTVQVDPTVDQRLIITPPQDLPAGTYLVAWHNLSTADGHPNNGFFTFSIGSASGDGMFAVGSAAAGPPWWWNALGKGLAYLGLAILIAVWPMLLFVAGQTGWGGERPWTRLWGGGAGLFLVGSILALFNQAWIALPHEAALSRVRTVLFETRYGDLWLWRMGIFALACGLAIAAQRTGRQVFVALAGVFAAAIPITIALNSHAAAAEHGRAAAITADVLHLTGAMLWIGGLICLAMLIRFHPEHLRKTVRRFSGMAIGLWIVLALTGALSAWSLVGSRAAVTGTPYGQTLIAKGAFLLPALLLAAINLIWFSPRLRLAIERAPIRLFRRSVVLELAFAIAALLTVGRLVGLQPAGDVEATRNPTAIVQEIALSGHAGQLTITPGTAGPNSYLLSVPDAPSAANVEGLLRLTPPGATKPNKEVKLVRNADGTFGGEGSELALMGEWEIEVVVRQIGAFQWSAETPAIITAGGGDLYSSPVWTFDLVGAVGMVVLALGIVGSGIAMGWGMRRREVIGGLITSLGAGSLLLIGRLPG